MASDTPRRGGTSKLARVRTRPRRPPRPPGETGRRSTAQFCGGTDGRKRSPPNLSPLTTPPAPSTTLSWSWRGRWLAMTSWRTRLTSRRRRRQQGQTTRPGSAGPPRERCRRRRQHPTCSDCRRCTSSRTATSRGTSSSLATPMGWQTIAQGLDIWTTRNCWPTLSPPTRRASRGASATSTRTLRLQFMRRSCAAVALCPTPFQRSCPTTE